MFRFIVLMVILVGSAGAIPIANEYSGTVHINGGLAHEGAAITASVESIMLPYSSYVNKEGRFILQVTGEEGQKVQFFINGKAADQQDMISKNENDTFDPFVEKNMNLTIFITPGNTGSSSGGGGGGGGGGASGEKYENIEMKEKYDRHIYIDETTSYRFTHTGNPVMFVNITGNVNAGEITTMVEVLKKNSSLVKTHAPGTVYKNVNIWVGTSGFAVPKNIKEARIKFRVENLWINSLKNSDIRMVKWDGGKWVELETIERSNDGTITCFEAMTDSFSSFAITGIKVSGGPVSGSFGEVTATQTTAPVATEPEENTPGFGAILAISGFLAVFVLWKKRR